MRSSKTGKPARATSPKHKPVKSPKASKQKSNLKSNLKSKLESKLESKKKSNLWIQAGKEVWPLEKDILFRPDRFKYVRKLIHPEGCVFCTAAKNEPAFETLCVFQTQFSMIVMNKFPYNSGHLLVIPKRHIGDPLSLTDAEFDDLHQVLRTALKALKQVYQPGGMNIGLNLGAVAGAGIPEHMHYHVIPRWAGDLNFFPLVAETKTVIESLEVSFDRLVAYFKNID